MAKVDGDIRKSSVAGAVDLKKSLNIGKNEKLLQE